MNHQVGEGTYSRYTAGCRCEECREANRVYMRGYKARRKAAGGRLTERRLARSRLTERPTAAAWNQEGTLRITCEITEPISAERLEFWLGECRRWLGLPPQGQGGEAEGEGPVVLVEPGG